jgi:Protein of unknown function (DUF3014)
MNKAVGWIIGVVAVLVIATALGIYLWQHNQSPPKPPPEPVTIEEPPERKAESKAEPAIRYPIETARQRASEPGGAQADAPLPALSDSDAPLNTAVGSLVGKKAQADLFQSQDIVHRIVATIDNLPREKAAQRLLPVKPIGGRFVTATTGDAVTISPANAARYAPFVAMVEAVDAKKVVAVYARFYPLFQQEYRALGYPNQYFNDRLIEAIDDLLATPEVPGPIKLVQPKVLYQFADPELESLSAGQKALIRMGSDNAARIKTRLRAIRRELTGLDKNR